MDKKTRTRLKEMIDAHQREVKARTDKAHHSLMRELNVLCGGTNGKGVVVKHDGDGGREDAGEPAARRWLSD